MRPALKSGLLPVWRDRETLQIGIDPRRAIALSGMGQAAAVIGLLDGSRDRDQLIAAAALAGVPEAATERILTLLAAGGVLDDFPAATYRDLSVTARAALAAELAATSLARGDGDGGARTLARRRAAVIGISDGSMPDGSMPDVGTPGGRIARAVGEILTEAGVGRVRLVQWPAPEPPPGPAAALGRAEARATSQPAAPGKTTAASRAAAPPKTTAAGGTASRKTTAGGTTAAGATTAAGGIATGRGWPPSSRPDLVVLVGRHRAAVADHLTKAGIAHLAISAVEAIGIVGPLVLPGRTACLRCLDYARAAMDPAWPLILAQLDRRRPDPPACDAVLSAAVAAHAAAQVLTAIDVAPVASAAAGGTLELVLPDWRWRRRSWSRHPACLCAGHST